jgi:hypothetical protein
MPPRGYRDETKWLIREIAESAKVLAKIGNEESEGVLQEAARTGRRAQGKTKSGIWRRA